MKSACDSMYIMHLVPNVAVIEDFKDVGEKRNQLIF